MTTPREALIGMLCGYETGNATAADIADAMLLVVRSEIRAELDARADAVMRLARISARAEVERLRGLLGRTLEYVRKLGISELACEIEAELGKETR